jgi:hypothetical protein
VRPSFRISVHSPEPPRVLSTPTEEDEDRFVDRPCYEFNSLLRPAWNDRHCEHCRHYLTARCPHIDEFLDDVEDLTPE